LALGVLAHDALPRLLLVRHRAVHHPVRHACRTVDCHRANARIKWGRAAKWSRRVSKGLEFRV
jgi:hypothetical protein